MWVIRGQGYQSDRRGSVMASKAVIQSLRDQEKILQEQIELFKSVQKGEQLCPSTKNVVTRVLPWKYGRRAPRDLSPRVITPVVFSYQKSKSALLRKDSWTHNSTRTKQWRRWKPIRTSAFYSYTWVPGLASIQIAQSWLAMTLVSIRVFLQELDLMEDDSVVYKLIGPVLVKQELAEARQNVDKRLEYISKEM